MRQACLLASYEVYSVEAYSFQRVRMIVFRTVSRNSRRLQAFMLMLGLSRELRRVIFVFRDVFGGLLSRRKRIPKGTLPCGIPA